MEILLLTRALGVEWKDLLPKIATTEPVYPVLSRMLATQFKLVPVEEFEE
jgi:hypothetical protein